MIGIVFLFLFHLISCLVIKCNATGILAVMVANSHERHHMTVFAAIYVHR